MTSTYERLDRSGEADRLSHHVHNLSDLREGNLNSNFFGLMLTNTALANKLHLFDMFDAI